MNSKGHPKTLVAKHPGNRNAVKAGVFSDAVLAPRVQELASAISERPPRQVASEVLEREVAALCALGEAMDQSLESTGLNGRRGEPRRMIELRLRHNDRLRRTLDQYLQNLGGLNALGTPGYEPQFEPIAEIDRQIEALSAEIERRRSPP